MFLPANLLLLAEDSAEAAPLTLYDVGGGGFFVSTSVSAAARAALNKLEKLNHAD